MCCLKTSVFDTFNDEARHRDNGLWSLIQGGRLGVGCTLDIDERGLLFDGHGRRQAVTNDLDLRNAK